MKSVSNIFGRLRTRLLLLTALTLLPLFLLAIYGNFRQRRLERTSAEERITAAAKLAAAREASLFDGTYQLLASWSQFPSIVMMPYKEYSILQCLNLLKLSTNHANIGLIEANGDLYANGARTNASMVMRDKSYFQRVKRTQHFAIGDLESDALVNEPCLTFGYPLSTNSELKRIFFASLRLPLIAGALRDIPLPDSAASWVFDSKGNVLARYPDNAKWAGNNLSSADFVQHALADKSSSFSGIDPGGAKQLYAASPILVGGQSNIVAVISVPEATLFAAADSALLRNFLIMAVIAILAIELAMGLGKRLILRPLNAVVVAANRLSKGDLGARTGIAEAPGEIDQLARTFDAMADNLEARQKDLVRANAEITRINDDLEKRVKERTAELEVTIQELEGFSYSVSHDLRAPLRHISGFVNMLSEHEAIARDESITKCLNTIDESAQRMGTLVDNLLEFSRMGRAAMRLKDVDLNTLVHEVRDELMSHVHDRKIEWQIHPLPVVRADAAMLRQVVVNLLSNAMKYTGTRAEARIEIGCNTSEKEHIIFIKDNGVGFDMQYVDKLFGVFERLHQRSEFEGTGIGLANVERIIHRHNGRVWAEGAVDKGATFYFSLPKVP